MNLRILIVSLVSLLSFQIPSAQARLIDCAQLPDLFQKLLYHHMMYRTLTDTIKSNTVEQFIKSLDPSRTHLLASDVEELRKSVPKMFETMKTANCDTMDTVYNLTLKRAKENEAAVRPLVKGDFKVDDSIELTLDPEKRGYAKSETDRATLLKSMVHFQMANYLLTKPNAEEAKKLLIHRYELITRRTSERNPAELVSMFAEAFSTALDPHTTYFPKDESDDFKIHMNLSLEGIGVTLTSQDGYVIVEDIIPGGSADRANLLKPQDKIIAVAQKNESPVTVIDMDLKDVVKLIRGKKGTEVKLTLLRQAKTTKTLTISLIRDKVAMQDQAAKIFFKTGKAGKKAIKIGILDLPAFYGGREKDSRNAYRDVKELLTKAVAEKVDALILDLSRNGGGLLEDAVKISGLFIKKGPIVGTLDNQGSKEILADTDDGTLYSGPLLILTSRLSASASEILAGALKDYRRGLLVGADHTFGKGSIQVLSELPMELGAIKITTGMYFIPKGASTQHQGVAADIVLPSVFSNDQIGEKTLDYSLPPKSIEPFVGKEANSPEPARHWKEVDDALVKRLSDASKARIAKNPKFDEIKKEIQEIAKSRDVVKLSELRKKSAEDKRKSDEEKKSEKKRKRGIDLDGPQIQESINIVQDWLS